MCDSHFVDRQVLTMIKSHPGLHAYKLVGIANEEHRTRVWTYDDIRHAAERLEKKSLVKSELTIISGRACKMLFPASEGALP